MMMCFTLCRSPSATTCSGPINELKAKAAHNAACDVRCMVEPPSLCHLTREQITLARHTRSDSGLLRGGLNTTWARPGVRKEYAPQLTNSASLRSPEEACQDEKLRSVKASLRPNCGASLQCAFQRHHQYKKGDISKKL